MLQFCTGDLIEGQAGFSGGLTTGPTRRGHGLYGPLAVSLPVDS